MKRMTRWFALLALLAGPMAAFAQTTTTTTTLPVPNVQLNSLPNCSGGACIPRLDSTLGQLRGVKLCAVTGGMTANVNATKTLADASANTLVFFALIGGEEGNNLRISTARVGTTAFDVTIKRLTVTLETFKSVSMVNSNARWVAKIINEGIPGQSASRYVRVVDLESNTADPRPSNVTDQAFTTGAGEATCTGVKRGDYIASVVNTTDGTTLVATDYAVSTDNKIVTKTVVDAAKKLVVLFLPTGGG